MTDEERRSSRCPSCEREKVCNGCEDLRPTAADLKVGWDLLTPFGRWEVVTRIEKSDEYGPLLIWTDQVGDALPWPHHSFQKVDAREPRAAAYGSPEIRVVEYEWRDGPMFAIATRDAALHVERSGPGVLVQAQPAYREAGWDVVHWPAAGPAVVTRCASKGAARTELRRVARVLAKQMGATLKLPAKPTKKP